ncbi:MAG: MraY family glycosyltransferase, partial [Planctomycetota bacterium]|nr:MraY family glycosyltransferase [Planctomycetota bacterium]
AQVTPRTGGLAIFVTFCIGLLIVALAPEWFGVSQGLGRMTFAMCLSAGALCAIGAWDDRNGMGARTKFTWQVIAIAPFVLWGRPADSLALFGLQIESALVTIPVVLLWLVACCNFINLLDGLDGLAGTLGLIVCLTAGALAGWQNQPETLAISVALGGALVGFLMHNWPPARIFMGDCGSLPLGFLVGALSLQASAKKAAGLTLVVPAVLLAVPLVDTAMAILRRKLNGRKIGHGDRGHIHHCLRDRGLSPSQTLLVVAGFSLFAAVGAAVATLVHSDLVAVVIGAVLVTALIGGRVFGFQETMLLARHFEAVWSLIRGFPRTLRARLVALRMESGTAAGEMRLWDKIVRRAKRMDVMELEFCFEPGTEGRLPIRLHWEADSPGHPESLLWQTSGTLLRTTNSRATFRLDRTAGGAVPILGGSS